MLGDRREFSALQFACGLPPRWSSEKCLVQVTRAASNVVSAVNRLHVDRLSPAQGSLAHTDNLKNRLPRCAVLSKTPSALAMCMFGVFVHYTLIDVATFLACSYS